MPMRSEMRSWMVGKQRALFLSSFLAVHNFAPMPTGWKMLQMRAGKASATISFF
jgi:hypothetical protein